MLAPFVGFAATLYGLRSAFRNLDGCAATWRTAVNGILTSFVATVALMVAVGCALALFEFIARRYDGNGAA
jgi:biopolymer transport protein ExbB/TolQ